MNKKLKIFDYINYRDFLSDFYEFEKKKNPKFSHRNFLKKAGIPLSNASVLAKVISGKTNLSESYRLKFIKSIGLTGKASQFFDYLVQFNQAKTMEQKNYYFQYISSFRGSKAEIIKTNQYKYFSKWYYAVVRSFISLNTKEVNPQIISQKIFPPLGVSEIKESIKLLIELELIKKMANGYSLVDNHIATEKEVEDMFAKQYIEQQIQLALKVFQNIPAERRFYYTNVFTISPDGVHGIKERLDNFLEEQREFIGRDKGETDVYTLNIQMFPNTKA